MQYLVIFTTKQRFETEGMPADFEESLLGEQAQGRAHYAQGDLRQSWELDMIPHGAACIFEAESPEHLQGMIDRYPFVKKDYADYQVFPLKPDSAYYRLES